MPRQPRIDIQGQLYHVIARGIERTDIFRDADVYGNFISRLGTALKKTNGSCMAWCLMPNHFHLLILRGTRQLSELTHGVLAHGVLARSLGTESWDSILISADYSSIYCPRNYVPGITRRKAYQGGYERAEPAAEREGKKRNMKAVCWP